jgi:hypothetical protein
MDRTKPVATGRATEELVLAEASAEAIVPTNMTAIVTGLEGTVGLPSSLAPPEGGAPSRRARAIPDGNRGAILPDVRVELWGREFMVSLKGIGSRHPMYGDGSVDLGAGTTAGEDAFASESWFGESPWGAMGHRACLEDATITQLATQDGLNGFHICPLVRATPLPEWLMRSARSNYWYRRLGGDDPYYQEARLLPSDVRLFYQSETTLGLRTQEVMGAFGLAAAEDLDAFLDNYLRSGVAALTLTARTVYKDSATTLRALDYCDVWLDKDSVLAPDGTVFFADIEGLDWVPLISDEQVERRMRRQFERNIYEFMFGVDRLLRERERMSGRTVSREGRRRDLAERLELALDHDMYVDLDRTDGHLDLVVLPRKSHAPEMRLRFLDLDGGPQ